MWELPTLFIASSSRAKILASEIAALLNERGTVQAESWTAEDAFTNNKQLLKSLIEHSQSKDFAVVILTKDDELTGNRRKEQTGDEDEATGGPPSATAGQGEPSGHDARETVGDKRLFAPRDNCIFELGLFIGAFGTPERCFLLTSLDAKHLNERLSDLGGQIFQGFVPPGNMESRALCRLTAHSCISAIERMVDRHGRFLRRPRIEALTTDELLAIEGGQGQDSPEPHSTILIKESEPPETELKYARVVRDNIVESQINYHYFFEPKIENCALVARMLRALIVSGLVEPDLFADCERLNERERKRFLLDRVDDVKCAIAELKNHMFVRFSEYVRFDEFCIHNANRQNKRRGYVKVGDRYAAMSKEKAHARYLFVAPRKDWPADQIVDPNPPELLSKALLERVSNVPEKGAAATRAKGRGTRSKDKQRSLARDRQKKTPEGQQKRMQRGIAQKLRLYFPAELRGVIGEACFGKQHWQDIQQELVRK